MAPLAGKLLLIIAATCVSNGFVLRRRHPGAHGIGSLHQRPCDQSDTGDATARGPSSRIQDVVGADCGEKTPAAPDPDASARRRLLATTLTAGCGCCGSAIQAADALELSERESPYDKRRNPLVDKFFADGMATEMDDYESKAKPYKSQLFRNMFRTLSEQKRGGQGAASVIVEVGMGTFPNAHFYAEGMKSSGMDELEVIGVDPNDSMTPYARKSAKKAGLDGGVSLRNVHGVAEALPLQDGSVDAVVCTLTLCSVPDQGLALAEIRRVLRPGGTFLFWEHVLSRDDIGLALQQRLLTPLQTIVADGCHLDRQTGRLIRQAGFEDVQMEYVSGQIFTTARDAIRMSDGKTALNDAGREGRCTVWAERRKAEVRQDERALRSSKTRAISQIEHATV
ncbi:hypothetical protein THAOC_26725, partial [Thalassiosira oceanica]